jgi:hypothetical protein
MTAYCWWRLRVRDIDGSIFADMGRSMLRPYVFCVIVRYDCSLRLFATTVRYGLGGQVIWVLRW